MFMDGAPRVYDLGLAVARMPATQPVGPDLTWLLGNYGKDAASTVQLLLVWAALLGCDVNHRSDGKGKGPVAACRVLQYLGSHCSGKASEWTAQQVVAALRAAEYRSKAAALAALPSDAVQQIEAVFAAFREQPVLQDVLERDETGLIGPLCGGSYSDLPRSAWHSVQLPAASTG